MVHGDDNGLVLPPKVAPIQLAIIPIAQHKPGVLDKANEMCIRDSAHAVREIGIGQRGERFGLGEDLSLIHI